VGQSAQTGEYSSDLFQHHGVVMLLIDPESGTIVDANPTAADYYGYSRSQLLQMNIQQINTLSRSQVEQEFRRAAKEQRNYFLFNHQLADGSTRTVEVYSSPVTVEGRPLLYSIIHDVEQKQSFQQAVATSETQLRFAEQVAGLGHWTLDLKTNTYEFSQGAMTLLGLEAQTWPAAAIQEMVDAEFWQQMVELKQELLDGTHDYRLDLRFQRPDGAMIDLHTEGVYDADSHSIFGIVHDTTNYHEAMRSLTSRTNLFLLGAGFSLIVLLGIIALLIASANYRKKTEAKLRDSEQRFDQLARQNRSVTWEVDHTGRYTYISAVAQDVLGYNPQQIINRMHFYDLHPENGREQFKEDCFAVFQEKGTFQHVENPIVTRSGKIIWVATTGIPILDNKGELIGYRGSDTDISDRKQAQLALEMKNREMEQFVYAVSHDLNSPLCTVRAFLNILEQDLNKGSTTEIEESFFHIRSAADKMAQLLGALQTLSQAGHFSHQPVALRINDLVSNCLTTLAGSIVQRQASIKTADFPQTLYGDPVKIEQIWQNLIENALKYMGDQPQPYIDIGYDDTNEGPEFFVCDNGMGINPGQMERIFGIFSQLDTRSEGIGLGLALVKKVVESYQGKIWVESGGPNQGSCFKFTLPGAASCAPSAIGKVQLLFAA
jgi:PAS domain S-box-containing protein